MLDLKGETLDLSFEGLDWIGLFRVSEACYGVLETFFGGLEGLIRGLGDLIWDQICLVWGLGDLFWGQFGVRLAWFGLICSLGELILGLT